MRHKALVKKALTELFIKGDLTALGRYWSDQYVQHNPMTGNGHDALKGLSLGRNGKAEIDLMIEEGDFVMVHSQHWDVLQEEVLARA